VDDVGKRPPNLSALRSLKVRVGLYEKVEFAVQTADGSILGNVQK